MPLVLSENEATESGIRYDDRTGVSYQFPTMYRNLIRPGMRFVYYRGRKSTKGRRPQVYIGAGAVGQVSVDAARPKRLVCEIIDYLPFSDPVPFKQGHSGYLEVGGKRRGYYQRGVRIISDDEYSAILLAAAIIGPTASSKADDIDSTAARQRSIARMAKTALQTAEYANGQMVSRRMKHKEILLSPGELEKHIADLLQKQSGRCAITGLPLQYDKPCG